MAQQLSKREAEFLQRFFAERKRPPEPAEPPMPPPIDPATYNKDSRGWVVFDSRSREVIAIHKNREAAVAATRVSGALRAGSYVVIEDTGIEAEAAPVVTLPIATPGRRPAENAIQFRDKPWWWHHKIIRQHNREMKRNGKRPIYPVIVR
jgi:hypothetical protein